jgi:hypothetical protein
MAQQIQGKTIFLILGIIVLIFVVSLYGRNQIFDWFNQLPGYQGNEDITIIPEIDKLAYVGGCNPPVAEIVDGQYIKISINGKDTLTDIYYKSPDIIGVHRKGILTDHTVGKVTSHQIEIKENVIRSSDYGAINNLALKIIQNKFLAENANYICELNFLFKCGSYNSLQKPSLEDIEKYNLKEEIFKTNSKDFPSQFDEFTFRALLVAFVEKEGWSFDENKIKELSELLNNAMNDIEEDYLFCRDYKSGEKIICIASIYKTGAYYQNNKIGLDYALELVKISKKWQNYFCNNQALPLVEAQQLNWRGKTKELIKEGPGDFYLDYGRGEKAGSNYNDYAGRGISNEKSIAIFNTASSFIGTDTVRYGCKGSEHECRDLVCARFVSNVLIKTGININIKDGVIALEEEILKKGGVKIYDKKEKGIINPKNKELILEIVNPGYIGVFSSGASTSGYHIVVLSGYDQKSGKVLYVHDGGYKNPVMKGKNSLGNLVRVYKIS